MQTTTQYERECHVRQMRANFFIEDMYADHEDLIMQQRYIAGTADIQDLLNYAKNYSLKLLSCSRAL